MTKTKHRSSLALTQIPLLDGISAERLDALARQCLWRTVDAEQLLLARDDDRQEVYFLVSGSVRVTRYSPQGRRMTFRDCQAGELLGDIAAIDAMPRSADVMTLGSSVVAILDRSAFIALLQDEPQAAEWMM